MKILEKDSLRRVYSFILFIIIGISFVYSMPVKKIITIEDVKLWRKHSVTLSDNGQWHTVLYSLIEKPDLKKKDRYKKNCQKR